MKQMCRRHQIFLAGWVRHTSSRGSNWSSNFFLTNSISCCADKLSYRKWCGQCDAILATCKCGDIQGIHSFDDSDNFREISGTAEDQRRSMNYLYIITHEGHAAPSLSQILTSCPYHMPPILLDKLKNSHDIQRLVRRQSGVHFDSKYLNFPAVSWSIILLSDLLL